MNKDQIIQQAQEKVEETFERVKETLKKESTQNIIKGAVGGAIVGGALMMLGKKKK